MCSSFWVACIGVHAARPIVSIQRGVRPVLQCLAPNDLTALSAGSPDLSRCPSKKITSAVLSFDSCCHLPQSVWCLQSCQYVAACRKLEDLLKPAQHCPGTAYFCVCMSPASSHAMGRAQGSERSVMLCVTRPGCHCVTSRNLS